MPSRDNESLRLLDEMVRERESAQHSLETWAKEEVTAKLIDEKGLRALAKNEGKRLRLINVWATWCGPCVEELPEFVAMNRMYRNRGFSW